MTTTAEKTARALTDRAKAARTVCSVASSAAKNAVLASIARLLEAESASVAAANARDLDEGAKSGLAPAMLDRLKLDVERTKRLAHAVREIVSLEDPVGRIDALVPRSSGIVVGKMRVPLGTVLMVYESRPNVTVDAAVLTIKTGNAVILRGGKEARETNRALIGIVRRALLEQGLPEDAAILVDDPDREILYALLRESGRIDLAIPRGGTSLIDAVNAHARVPVIQHYQGICHVFVHGAADLEMAVRIAVNAKVERPGVCNAMETLLVDQACAAAFLPDVARALGNHGVELRCCDRALALVGTLPHVKAASALDFDTEFLALICAVKIVDGLDDALAFIRAHGSNHTASIVTRDHDAAMQFLRSVDASCVLVNASTRFNDGGELGLGAELGISTTKLHAYGPMGLTELTAQKFVVLGHGETRGKIP
jgi:glutamate-5-semialdehyde dehydrogenase